ncbi:hypothetical protein ORJ04_19020 [Rheinheimera baltica]|uniref:MvdD-like pre-ATP grasp domain-containing protein n=2 Tax=Rheinheimera baltica TaxID=67576 RepID=A0ABT9I4W6_9GAMM|nr:hypothetical protein [Rheinheimera baltica]MDP5138045.1 hypothetical protein [Rheinheimera baltica]MDP5150038.1 hypothetical protein [Rheinheimera baltica]
MSVVLAVSHSEDIHVDLVLSLISHEDIQLFRLDADCFPRDYQFWYGYTPDGLDGELLHLPSGKRIRLADITAVWLRKPAPFSFISADLSQQEQAFAVEETEHALLGLLYSLKCFWVNHPLQLRGAMWKVEQLQRAIAFGFDIPESLITNIPSRVRRLASSSRGGIIFKALSSSWLAAEQVDEDQQLCTGLATTLLTEKDLSDLSAVTELPCHFQHYSEKQYELRVTVIGDQVFAARIDANYDNSNSVDCRDSRVVAKYSPYHLPGEWAQSILNFVRSYGLLYSALDFIVSPEQKLIFLENNPNGQFLYVEQQVPEFQLCQVMADLLTESALCQN